jgi:hypothetical protein
MDCILVEDILVHDFNLITPMNKLIAQNLLFNWICICFSEILCLYISSLL